MINRGKHGQQPNKVNYEDLVNDLLFGTITITTLESAFREYIRRRTDIPEGARDLLAGKEYSGLISFASTVKGIVGSVELAYYRGRQEGHEVKDPKKWSGGMKNKAVESNPPNNKE